MPSDPSPSFNLIDQPWIPALTRPEWLPRTLSLREALVQAHQIQRLADSSPLVEVALHRLLLAVVHRCFGPASLADWAALWERGRFDEATLGTYLDRWRDRFDLFDPERPFYQVADLDFSYARPIVNLVHELLPGSGNHHFNHAESLAPELSPAAAARYLVAHQSFAVGGLVSFDLAAHRSADAAPLTKGAVALASGGSLFETLLLNLHRYNPADDAPFAVTGTDQPAWERAAPTRAEDRWPSGYLDLLTWQSRRIRLQPDRDGAGDLIVPAVVIMKGNQFPDGFHRHGRETMLAFRKAEKAGPGQDPWPAITFQEGRALWRDSLALLQSLQAYRPGDRECARPRLLDWLAELVAEGTLSPAQTLPLTVTGLGVDRAKIFFWRQERLPLPLAYLADPDLVDQLRAGLGLAEAVGSAVEGSVWLLAKLLLAPESDDSEARQPDKNDVRRLADSLAAGRRYWPHLEASFGRLVEGLAQARLGAAEATADPLRDWATAVQAAGRGALAEIANSLDASARALKAVARAQRTLSYRLAGALNPYLKSPEEVSA